MAERSVICNEFGVAWFECFGVLLSSDVTVTCQAGFQGHSQCEQRQAGRHADRQAGRQADGQAGRQAGIQVALNRLGAAAESQGSRTW